MADKKISALTPATTPLAGTEVLPIVQSGSTVKVAVSDLTDGRAVNALSITLPNVEATTTYTGSGAYIGRGTAFSAGQAELYTAGTRPLGLGTTGAGPLRLYTASTQAISIDTSQNITFVGGNLVQGAAAKGVNFTANTPAAGMTSQLLNWYEEGTWTPIISGLTLTTALGTYTRIGKKVFANFEIASSALTSGTSALISGLPFNPNTSATEADRPAGYLTYNPGTKNWTLLFGSNLTTVAFRENPGGTTGTITDLSGQTLWGTLIYTAA